MQFPPRSLSAPGPVDRPAPAPTNEPPEGLGTGSPLTTPKNQVLFIPPDALTALFKDPEGGAISVAPAGQPAAGKGSAAAMEGGGIAFKPQYGATGPSEFPVAARDPAGASSTAVPLKITVQGGWTMRC
jgi:hypothetical protein